MKNPHRKLWKERGIGFLILCATVLGPTQSFPESGQIIVLEDALTPLFELDTRGDDWSLSPLFTLDTRDEDVGALSALFTLDTRGDPEPVTPLFTLDTRGLDSVYAPTNVQLVAEALTVIRVSWAYQGVPLGFVVQRRAPLGTWHATTLSGGTLRSWLDTAVVPGNFYEYRVAAVLPTGVAAYSDIAYIQAPSVPNAPTSLTAEWSEAEGVALAWEDKSHNEKGFELWRKAGPSGTWNNLAEVPSNTTAYFDFTVDPSTVYKYRIRAYNRWGASAFSDEVSASTPGPSGGCGFQLQVDGGLFTLDGDPVDFFLSADIDGRALVQGTLTAWLRSPPGNPHPVRVVLGFRDAQGRATGQPVELMEFYTVPGCPGLLATAAVPPSFRAPEEGTHTLWAEMIMAQRDPVISFMTERHAQESPMRKRLFDVVIRSEEATAIRVRVLDEQALPDTVADVPIHLVSDGGIHTAAFSIQLDEGLEWVDAELGADAPQALLQIHEQSPETIGITFSTPSGNPLGKGAKHILTLQVRAGEPGTFDIQFADAPVLRTLSGGPADTVPVSWENGELSVAPSTVAGDIFPRPYGDGVVDDQDVRLALLFALGVLDPPDTESEFQRLDSAPIESCGDGIIDIADVVAIQLYAANALPPAVACSPTDDMEPTALGLWDTPSRTIFVDAPAAVYRGESVWFPLMLEADGDEHGLALSLQFDSNVLAYQDMRLTGAATNGVFLPNLQEAIDGVVSFALTLPESQTFAAGERPIAEIQFLVLEGTETVLTSLAFIQSPAPSVLVDQDSHPLDANFIGADVIVYASLAASAPVAPPSVQAEALSMHQIRITWSPAPWSTGYKIRRKLSGETGWSVLALPDQSSTLFLDQGLAPGTVAEYLVSSMNPLDEESGAVRVQARTWTELENWRYQWFGTIANEGDAADDADPDGDAIPNRLERELGLNPLVSDAAPFALNQEEVFTGIRSLTLSYTIGNNAPDDVRFEVTDDLLDDGAWRPVQLAPVTRSPVADGESIKLRLPDSETVHPALFLRMRAD